MAAVVLLPFWAPLLLAAWTAELAERPYRWLSKKFGERARGAAAVIVLLVVALLVPLSIVVVSLSGDAVDLVKQAAGSGSTSSALQTMVSSGKGGGLNTKEVVTFVQKNGPGAWQVAQVVFGALVAAVLGAFIYLYGTYEFLVNGTKIQRWTFAHSPIASRHLSRFTAAFRETGRGLFIGVGLTALAQGLGATIGYFALGIPQAAVLGLLTCITAMIPSFGAGLVWAPVTLGLALTGRPGAAVVMGLIGVFISTADNFLRPVLARYGKLDMSTFLLLLSMLGGMALLGTWGLILGPLMMRLAIEACAILREERWLGPDRDMKLVDDAASAPSD